MLAYDLAAKRPLYDPGGTPTWRQDQMSGFGAGADPSAQYDYPLAVLYRLWPPEAAAGPTFWLHALLVGLASLVLGRALRLSWPASLFLGLTALCSVKFILSMYAGWSQQSPALVLTPLALALVTKLEREPTPRRVAWLALVAAATLTGAHPQMSFYFGGLIVAWALWLGARHIHAGGLRSALPFALALIASALLAAGLAAVLWLPLAKTLPLLSRSSTDYEFFLSGRSFGWRNAPTLLHPELAGNPLDGSYPVLWEDLAYFGLVQLGLALLAIRRGWRDPRVLFFAGCGVLSFLLAFDSPVLRLAFEHLPVVHLFRCPNRVLFVTALCVQVLAAIELQALWPQPFAGPRRALVLALVAVVLGEGLWYGHRYVTTRPREQVVPTPALVELLHADPEVFRVLPLGSETLHPGWSGAFGLQLVTGYAPFNYAHYWSYIELLSGQPASPAWLAHVEVYSIARSDLVDVLNVKYIVTDRDLGAMPPALQRVAVLPAQPVYLHRFGLDQQTLYLYRNLGVQPRAFWADLVEAAPTAEAARAVLERIDARRIAVTQYGATEPSPASPGDSVQIQEQGPGRLRLTTRSGARRFLVISEIWHPGWQARLDGQELPLLRTDLALLGAWVPAGAHSLSLRFVPPGRWAAQILSAASGLGILALLGWSLARARTRRS